MPAVGIGFDAITVQAEQVRSAVFGVSRSVVQTLVVVSVCVVIFLGLRTETNIEDVLSLHTFEEKDSGFAFDAVAAEAPGNFLADPTFHSHRSETQLLRYMQRLQERDLSRTTSMIPLGSCTMKLNATTEMEPITWDGFAGLHPFAPLDQAAGYEKLKNGL